MNMVSFLYRLARLARDVQVLSSGNPQKIGRRIVNKALGRSIIRRLWWK
jgi:hypothetical protein